VKKTPIEHVLEQIEKQEEKVNALREELKKEEQGLAKLQKAKAVLEATD
jgi:cell division septum initiation protein DivIVA